MPRRSRMYLPGFTYHIVQRGNNREVCFFEEENYRVFIRYMGEVLPRYGVALHAYCLMTNHIHLLLTPDSDDGISRVMRVVCSRYAQYINKKYERTGTLWEGRHKASAIDSERYLLKCYRYIELNPVAAQIVERPEEYAWTSNHCNAWGDPDPLVTMHETYRRLGRSREHRCASYRALFREALTPEDRHAIRRAVHSCLPLGTVKFLGKIERKTGRPIGYAHRGRPYAKLHKNKSLRPL